MADALDLKSSEVHPSYRFKPGFRHHFKSNVYVNINQYRGVEQLVARRAHNTEVAGSNPVSATKKKTVQKDGFSFWFRGKRRLATFGYESDERGSLGKHSSRILRMIQRAVFPAAVEKSK